MESENHNLTQNESFEQFITSMRKMKEWTRGEIERIKEEREKGKEDRDEQKE